MAAACSLAPEGSRFVTTVTAATFSPLERRPQRRQERLRAGWNVGTLRKASVVGFPVLSVELREWGSRGNSRLSAAETSLGRLENGTGTSSLSSSDQSRATPRTVSGSAV